MLGWGLKHLTNKEVKAKLDGEESFHGVYIVIVIEWEEITNQLYEDMKSISNGGKRKLQDRF